MIKKKDTKIKIPFIILIGGKSARFGTDKGIFEYLGKPFIMHQIDVLTRFRNPIFIVSHSKEQIQNYISKIDYRKITAFIVDDRTMKHDKEIRTPLLGIYSAFKELIKLGYVKAFLLSCDMPFIQYKIIDLLLKKCKTHDCCIPRWENNYLEPLFAIYPVKEGYHKAKINLIKKDYKLKSMLDDSWDIKYISIEKEIQPIDKNLLSFININDLNDIKKIKAILRKKN
jgi:molybdopterin-guanine dinucleotide biosynthesis protein A